MQVKCKHFVDKSEVFPTVFLRRNFTGTAPNPQQHNRARSSAVLPGLLLCASTFPVTAAPAAALTPSSFHNSQMPADPDYVEEKEAPIKALDETDIAFLKNYGLGPYAAPIKKVEEDIKSIQKKVNEVCGIKESDTGLAPPSRWDLVSDKQMMQEEQPLQVARCTKIINPNTDDAKYVINVKQIAKFVVGLGDKVAPTDIEEGMRVGVDRNKYQIQIPLPPKIDPSVTMMTVEEKPDITYRWVCCMHGGGRGGSRVCPGRPSTGCRYETAAGHAAAKGAAAGPSNSRKAPFVQLPLLMYAVLELVMLGRAGLCCVMPQQPVCLHRGHVLQCRHAPAGVSGLC